MLGSFCIEIEASDGTKGFATGFGGPPACWLAQAHFERFLIGAGRSPIAIRFLYLVNHQVKIPEIQITYSNKCIEHPCFMVERVFR